MPRDKEPVGFEVVKEDWNVYKLEDGTTLRVKLVLGQVFKLVGEKTPEGEPVYQARSQNFVVAEVPQELKSGGKEA